MTERYDFLFRENELGIMHIEEDGERRAFFMNRDQFNQMLDTLKKEMPAWLREQA